MSASRPPPTSPPPCHPLCHAGSRRWLHYAERAEQEICRRRGWFPQLIFAYFLASLPSLPKSVGRYESEREREDPREAFTYR